MISLPSLSQLWLQLLYCTGIAITNRGLVRRLLRLSGCYLYPRKQGAFDTACTGPYPSQLQGSDTRTNAIVVFLPTMCVSVNVHGVDGERRKTILGLRTLPKFLAFGTKGDCGPSVCFLEKRLRCRRIVLIYRLAILRAEVLGGFDFSVSLISQCMSPRLFGNETNVSCRVRDRDQ